MQYNNLVEGFEHIVSSWPNKVAIKFKNKYLTYNELNNKANQLASYLKKRKIEKGVEIPFLLNRSEDVIITMLAILKVGAAFVPLSKETPKSRQNYILKQMKSPVVITKKELLNSENEPTYNLNQHIKSEDVAYIIFTSGTTGAPKGVMVSHGNILNSIYSHAEVLDLNKSHKNYLQFADYIFDASIIEIFPTLLHGHTLVITPENVRKDLNELSNFILNENIDCAIIPPAMLDKEELLSLNYLLVAGEPSNTEILNSYKKQGTKVINGYGPTELSVSVSLYEYNIGDTATTIGFPQKGNKFYILNENNELIKTNDEIGELIVSGKQLSQGYLNDLALTKEKFVYLDSINEVVYKTGDLVKRNNDKSYEFMGRKDNQVKIRGFRIELHEIESNLQKIEVIKQVVCHKIGGDLVAFYTSDNEIQTKYLRKYLRKTLPEYMIPNLFRRIKKIPLTSNGKTDKKKLEKMIESSKPHRQLEYSSLNTTKETIKRILNVVEIPEDKNLFEVGLNSITAIKIGQKLKIPASIVFEKKNIKGIENYLKNKRSFEVIKKRSNGLELSYAQKRLLFLDEIYEGLPVNNLSCSIILSSDIDVERIKNAIRDVISRHEVLRTNIINGCPYIVNKNIDITNFEVNDNNFFKKDFNLSCELPIRINIKNSRLSLCVHHIVFDGLSLEIFLREVMKIYNQTNLPSLEKQYYDFSEWHKSLIANKHYIEPQLKFWEEILFEFEELNLPIKRNNKTNIESILQNNKVEINLSKEMKKEIKSKALNNKTTEFIVLLNAYFLTLSLVTNQNDIIIGIPFSNRHYPVTESLIGNFVNVLPLRFKIHPEKTVEDNLESLTEAMIETSKNQDVPFERIVKMKELSQQSTKKGNPIFQTTISSQNFGQHELMNNNFFNSIKMNINYPMTNFYLSMFLEENQIIFSYSDEVLDESFVKLFATKFFEVLRQTLMFNRRNADIIFDNQSLLNKNELINTKNVPKEIYKSTIPQEYEAHESPSSVLGDPKSSINHISYKENIEKIVKQVLSTILDIEEDKVSIKDNFFSLGGDSIKAIKMASLLKKKGLKISTRKIVESQTIESLIEIIQMDSNSYSIDTSVSNGKVTPLPIQKWFFNKNHHNPNYFNQSYILEANKSYSNKLVNDVFRELIKYHDGLRIIMDYENKSTEQLSFSTFIESKFFLQTKKINKKVLYENDIAEICNKLQKDINIENKYSIIVNQLVCKEKTYFIIVVHHLVIDEVSWSILIEDFFDLLELPTNKWSLPEKTSSINTWAKEIEKASKIGEYDNEVTYWNNITIDKYEFLELKKTSKDNYYCNSDSITFSLTSEKTEDLYKKISMYPEFDINSVLLSALSRSVKRTYNKCKIKVMMEGHGRYKNVSNLSIDRTVGWFTTLYPIEISCEHNLIEKHIKDIKVGMEIVPNKGENFLSLLTSKKLKEDFLNQEIFELSFNYLGNINNNVNKKYSVLSIPDIKNVGDYNQKAALIEINCFTLNNKLSVSVNYSLNIRDKSKVKELVNTFKSEIERTFEYRSLKIDDNRKNDFQKIASKVSNGEFISKLTPMQSSIFQEYLRKATLTNNYTVQVVFEVTGNVSLKLLKEAFKKVVDNNEIFKMRYLYKGLTDIYQVLTTESKADIDVYHESDENEIWDMLNETSKKCFKLDEDALIKFSCFVKEDNKKIISFTYHHIIMDGWSINEFIQEFLKVLRGGELTKKKTDITRYVNTVHNYNIEQVKNYWKNYLYEYENRAVIPSFNIGETYHTDFVKIKRFKIINIIHKIQNLKKSNNSLSVNDFILGSWGIVLQKLTDSKDVVFGTIISGRNSEIVDFVNVIGLLIEQVPIRVKNKNNTFLEIIERVNHDLSTIPTHNNLSISEIMSLVNSVVPQHRAIIDNYPDTFKKRQKIDNESTIEFKNYYEQNSIDFGIDFTIENKDLIVEIKYNNKTYSDYDISKVQDIFKKVITEGTESPNIKVDKISIIEEEEMNLITSYEKGPISKKKNNSMLEHFSNIVKKNLNSVAVSGEKFSWTYKELDDYSNCIANSLLKKNANPKDRIALNFNNKELILPSILGVWKIGAVFVPLDPEESKEKNAFIISNSSCKFVLTDLNEKNDFDVQSLNICNLKEEHNTSNNIEYSCTDIAYIIYTSGSTGNPKGVEVGFSALTNYIEGMLEKSNPSEMKSSLVMSKVNYDLSYTALFIPLYIGGNITFIEKEDYGNSYKISRLIEKNKVTYIKTTPSIFSCLEYKAFSNCETLKLIILGGETPNSKSILEFLDFNPNVKFLNHYGPTEATIGCISGYINPDFLKKEKEYNDIGTPHTNVKIYILNSDKERVPIGTKGEIYISGACLSNGYLNNRTLTNDNFIYSKKEMLYKTGDIGRFTPNGTIEYCGRLDTQIKHLGYRIELTSIERQIKKVEHVQNSIVLQLEENLLGTLIVLDNNGSLIDVKKRIQDSLPKMMWPAIYLEESEIPITLNGKVDYNKVRLLLNKRRSQTPKSNYKYINLPDYKLNVFCYIKNILENQNLRLQDNFYETGGNSLTAIKLLSKLNQKYDKDIRLKSLITSENFGEFIDNILNEDSDSTVNVEKRKREEFYPISSQQKRMLSLNLINTDNKAYNLPIILEIEGIIDIERFKDSVARVVQNNEILRTKYVVKNSNVYQKVLKDFDITKKIIKTDNLPQKAELTEYIESFNLLNEIPIKYKVFYSFSQHKTIVLFNFHHICMDKVSYDLFLDQIKRAYEGVKLTDSEYQYKDYIDFQEKYFLEHKNRLVNYWYKKLSSLSLSEGTFSTLILNSDKFNGENYEFYLDEKLNEEINVFCKKYHFTKYEFLLSAFVISLIRLQDKKEIGVISNYLGRSKVDFYNTMGMFNNTIPHFFKIDNTKKVLDAMRKIKHQFIEDIDHGEMQFEKIVKMGKECFKKDVNSISDISFLYETERTELDIGNMRAKLIKPNLKTSKFNMTLSVLESAMKLFCTFEVKKDVYSIEMLREIENKFKKVINEIISCQGTERNVERGKKDLYTNSLLEDFEKNASLYPDKVCLIEENENITFSKLNNKANGFKYSFVNNIDDDKVLLLLPPKKEVFVAILAIWKAGKTYIPVDPKYPDEYIKNILFDSKSHFVITDKSNKERLEKLKCKALLIDYDNIIEIPKGESVYDFNKPAYITYTSGTTGKPKGIMISHKSLSNYIHWSQENYLKNQINTMAFYSSISFDLTVTSLFMCLTNGNKVKIFKECDSFKLLKKVLEDREVNIVKLTPAHLKIVDRTNIKLNKNLHTLIVGGEAFYYDLAKNIESKGANITIYNEYGPSETTVGAIVYKFDANNKRIQVPIGKTIDNMQAKIMVDGREANIGEVGEIYLGGIGLANGYISDSEDSDEKFVYIEGHGDQKFYKTGDLGAILDDGNIEYLGRQDCQVNINGYRVELESIHQSLMSLPEVIEAVVLKEDYHTNNIISYVVISNELSNINSNYITSQLRKISPEYMIPNSIRIVKSIPLTINGKVNEKKLKESTQKNFNTHNGFENKTINQRILLKKLESILKKSNLSLSDNYFELGGDSIQAIILSSELKDEGFSLEASKVLNSLDLNEMSEYIKKDEEVNFNNGDNNELYPISPIQNWFFNQKLENPNQYVQSLLLNMSYNYKYEEVIDALLKLIRKHPTLRTNFKRINNQLVRQYSKDMDEVEISKVIEYKKIKSDKFLEEIQRVSNDIIDEIEIFNGKLWKICFVEAHDSRKVLFVFHHLIIDIVSWKILIKDLEKALMKKTITKTTSYLEWSELINNKKQANKTLACAESIDCNLLTKEIKNPNEILHYKVELDVKESDLSFLNKQLHATTFEVTFTIIILSLTHVLKKENISVIIEDNGRDIGDEELNIENTIGWFTSFYSLDIRVDNEKDIVENIKKIKYMLRNSKKNEVNKTNNVDKQGHIKVNYFGEIYKNLNSSIFDIEKKYQEASSLKTSKINFPLEISCYFSSGKLIIDFEQFSELNEVLREYEIKYSIQKYFNEILLFKNELHKLKEIKHSNKGNESIKLHPVLPTQEGLYYEWLKDNSSSKYIEQNVFTLNRELDVEVLKRGLNILIEKYAALRTNFDFDKESNKPVQLVREKGYLDFNTKILNKKNIELLVEIDKSEPFDLKKGELFRITYISGIDCSDTILFTFHHLILDGWSKIILINEIRNYLSNGNMLYDSNSVQPGEYARFIEKQKNAENSKVFWTNYLANCNAKIHWPSEYLDKRNCQNINEYYYKFDKDILKKIKDMAISNQTTLSVIISTLWGISMYDYVSENDIVFGFVTSGRNKYTHQMSKSVGMFANTIPIRIKSENHETINEVIRKVKTNILKSLDNDYYSLGEILSYSSIKNINHLLVIENHEKNDKEIDFAKIETKSKTEFDLEALFGINEHLHIKLRYYPNKVSLSTLEHIITTFINLIDKTSLNGEIHMSQIDSLIKQDYKNRLYMNKINDRLDSKKQGQLQENLSEILQKSFRTFSERTAIISEDIQCSYSYLDKESNRIVQILREKNIHKGDVIGVFLDKSIELVASMIGIIKFGAVILPIDVNLPSSRREFMINDSNCSLILSKDIDMKNDNNYVDLNDYKNINVTNSEWAILDDNDLQYIIFTSGTTGKPKGVKISVGNLKNFIHSSQCSVDFSKSINMISITSISFDISISELLIPLIIGGKITILNNKDSKDPRKILQVLKNNECNTLQTTPTRLESILDSVKIKKEFESIEYVYLMGETLKKSTVKKLFNLKHVNLYNCYGPAEATIWIAAKKINNEKEDISVGKPIRNVEMYILDNNNNVTSEPYGHLAVSGNSLSKGYINNNKENNSSFVFINNSINKKVYLTGDLAKWNEQGEIEILGRKDNQIKVNGVRIETTEIEEVAKGYENIKNSTVLVDKTKQNMTLYLSLSNKDQYFDISSFRKFLTKHLLIQMLPQKIKIVSEIPVNNNDKVDLKKLEKLNSTQETKYIFNDVIEKDLSIIWSSFLETDVFSTNASFFDLGGNSLKVYKVISEINKYFNIDMSVIDFFNNPTIDLLSKFIKNFKNNHRDHLEGLFKIYPKIPENIKLLKTNDFKYLIVSSYILLVSFIEKKRSLSLNFQLNNTEFTKNFSFINISDFEHLIEIVKEIFQDVNNKKASENKRTKWSITDNLLNVKEDNVSLYISNKNEVIIVCQKTSVEYKYLNEINILFEKVLNEVNN
ncbi:non-ribosomal peptide synthetase [Staphylococcus saccharolyticus]|uniref:non-ribosomal peptide synthetase n=2 Tax=Staphylococcus saccharolyticus TaxID=33028 RepID=UPI00102DA4C1|nr:non-ribosomal peptide synthetase [Staphylococcus saccharolyticus]QRJ69281.1 amino acid adenylation domain-containing protein [Staphylococcus saccharolyticus]